MSCCRVAKPSSLPKNWPHPTKADLVARPRRHINIGYEQEYSFINNSIKTSRYEAWNFLAYFLFEEFNPNEKPTNLYFLVIGCLQIVPAITNTDGYPTVFIPLFVVLLLFGLLKALEDYERHIADKKANSLPTSRYNYATKEFEGINWADLEVGDLVMVQSRQGIPADIALIQTAEENPANPKGICFIETKSLDGETNLKSRNVIAGLLGKVQNTGDLADLRGSIEMEHPNNMIDSFSGVIEMKDEQKCPIQHSNVLLRGCVLRGTEWVVGVVLNTGMDVKVMQAGGKKKTKTPHIESILANQAMGVLIMLIVLCFSGATGNAIFNELKRINTFTYLDENLNDPVGDWFIQFFYYLLLHSSFIPVSLFVMMQLVRFLQAYFMGADLEMYYEESDIRASVRNMTLNEELGQISHIFSDKTGTLTCNNMNFRKASINGVSYGKGITEIGKAAWKLMGREVPPEVLEAERLASKNAVPHVAFYCPDYERDMFYAKSMAEPGTENTAAGTAGAATLSKDAGIRQHNAQMYQVKRIQDFYRYLAVCHEVVAEKLDDGKIKLSAPNPDDEALVCAAAYFGYEFLDRREGKYITIFESAKNRTIEVEVLNVIAFSSDRKRMSVVIRDIDRKIKIITKGADSAMFPRMHRGDEELLKITARDIDRFSMEGLRCLVVAAAEIEEEKYEMWNHHYRAAIANIVQIDKRKNNEQNDIDILEDFIEKGLHVIGATAIEDRLQDGVPECIEKLAMAGIKVWVLTGDKEETAINIAVACNLVQPQQYMEQIIINRKIAPDVHKAVEILKKELENFHKEQMELQLPDESAKAMGRTLRKQKEYSTVLDPEEEKANLESTSNFVNVDLKVKPRALIIDGGSLIYIMADPNAKALLLMFSEKCKAVVCCRVSPDQKREIVDLVRYGVEGVRTLAIGDGANDVAMIQAAHVGVGIKGEEGVQAVNASDYAIGQFRFLSVLLLKHGRYNYIRMSALINYMFYKNILMSSSMFWINFVNGFSGEKFYTEVAIQLFNLFYTSIPILLYGSYDHDIAPSETQRLPQLYKPLIKDSYFNTPVFISWVVTALIESLICGVLPLYLLMNYDYRTGMLASSEECGAVAYNCIIIIANMKIFTFQNDFYWITWLALAFSVGSWVGFSYITNVLTFIDWDYYFVYDRIMSSGTAWLLTLLIVGMIFAKDLFIGVLKRYVFYEPFYVVQEISKYGPLGYSLFGSCRKTSTNGQAYSETTPKSQSKPNSISNPVPHPSQAVSSLRNKEMVLGDDSDVRSVPHLPLTPPRR